MYEYTVRFGEATIVRHLREYDFEKHDTVIPAYLGSYPVVEIGRAAFQEQYMIGSGRFGKCACNRRVRLPTATRITEIKLPRTNESKAERFLFAMLSSGWLFPAESII